MSFLAWLALACFQSQLVMSMSSLVEPPVKLSSAAELTASAMNLVASAADVPALTLSQSSPGTDELLTALPSSSKRPSPWTASADGAITKAAYWSRIDNTNNADQSSAS